MKGCSTIGVSYERVTAKSVVDVDVLYKVGERINQTSGYGERLLDGGLTEGHLMKLEVVGIPPGLLRCGIWRNTWAGVVRIRS